MAKKKKWTEWKKLTDGIYIRTQGKYPAIRGKTQFKFTKGIDRRRTGFRDVLTARQRALDWRRGSHKTKLVRVSKVYRVKNGYVFTATTKAG